MLPSVRSQQVSLASSSLVSISFRYAVVIVISFTFFRPPLAIVISLFSQGRLAFRTFWQAVLGLLQSNSWGQWHIPRSDWAKPRCSDHRSSTRCWAFIRTYSRVRSASKQGCQLAYGISPLHGIPILIKNNIATSDKMNNTGKCQFLYDSVPSHLYQLVLGRS